MNGTPKSKESLGDLLMQLVNHVSHRPQAETLAIMSEASVTLHQVLLLNRLVHQEACRPSTLAQSLNMSLPSVSQMLDRLFQVGLVRRMENPNDRRQRRIAATPKAKALLRRLARARSAEYSNGVSGLSPGLLKELAEVLTRALAELRATEKVEALGGVPEIKPRSIQVGNSR
jgi:DNA-binding MarR family transcriptional regulator